MGVAQILATGAMQGLMALQDAVSHNIANASTGGYRRHAVAFRQAVDGLRRPVLEERMDLRAGPLERTGNALDVALEGDGFLVARSPAGDRYVRGGSLHVDQAGRLCTREGWPLLGESGRPVVVDGDRVEIASDGTVGSSGRLRVVSVPAESLRAEGSGLSLVPGARVTRSSAQVRQGFLEGANVETLPEMVRMIETLRSFEMLQRVVSAEDQMEQRSAADVGRVR